MQFVSEGDEKHEGSAAPWAEESSWPWYEELLSPCRGTQHGGMPCQAPTWLCQGMSLLATDGPEASTSELTPLMCNFVMCPTQQRRGDQFDADIVL